MWAPACQTSPFSCTALKDRNDRVGKMKFRSGPPTCEGAGLSAHFPTSLRCILFILLSQAVVISINDNCITVSSRPILSVAVTLLFFRNVTDGHANTTRLWSSPWCFVSNFTRRWAVVSFTELRVGSCHWKKCRVCIAPRRTEQWNWSFPELSSTLKKNIWRGSFNFFLWLGAWSFLVCSFNKQRSSSSADFNVYWWTFPSHLSSLFRVCFREDTIANWFWGTHSSTKRGFDTWVVHRCKTSCILKRCQLQIF